MYVVCGYCIIVLVLYLQAGLMKDHGQQARAIENFAGPVDFETPRPDLPVYFLNFQKPWLTSKIFTGPGLLAVVFHKPCSRHVRADMNKVMDVWSRFLNYLIHYSFLTYFSICVIF